MEISVLNASSPRWQMCDNTLLPSRLRYSPHPPCKTHWLYLGGWQRIKLWDIQLLGVEKQPGGGSRTDGVKGEHLGGASAPHVPRLLLLALSHCSAGSHTKHWWCQWYPRFAPMWVPKWRIPSCFQWSTMLFFWLFSHIFSELFQAVSSTLIYYQPSPRDEGLNRPRDGGCLPWQGSPPVFGVHLSQRSFQSKHCRRDSCPSEEHQCEHTFPRCQNWQWSNLGFFPSPTSHISGEAGSWAQSL